ncbi:hypothetical protein JCM8115_002212 [Rhodotorula mucilaginosa]|uniref:Uncharacterized protein n=1 Tax=Rhodotorula mucilaginosa TaxID=5537 RepID=A0A9P6VTF4_RHOMI|nr:hypothetical protein C6P46_001784 [Rhodotorula mucilaginosa]TKA52180.1 hypothetical protein B0A53_05024 [Rhodotorula sp. CCFEE 5036]
MERVQPKVTTQTLLLELDRFDAAFDQLFVAQLSVIGPNALWLAVGAAAQQPFSLMADTAVAMPRPGNTVPPAATSLSTSTSASLALAARLSKRYASQVFLSLDLSSLADAGGGPASSDRAMLPLEKALIAQLDQVLERPTRRTTAPPASS